jgi:hypothetical protein
VDELVDEFAVALFPIPVPFASAAFAFTCHGAFPICSREPCPRIL